MQPRAHSSVGGQTFNYSQPAKKHSDFKYARINTKKKEERKIRRWSFVKREITGVSVCVSAGRIFGGCTARDGLSAMRERCVRCSRQPRANDGIRRRSFCNSLRHSRMNRCWFMQDMDKITIENLFFYISGIHRRSQRKFLGKWSSPEEQFA